MVADGGRDIAHEWVVAPGRRPLRARRPRRRLRRRRGATCRDAVRPHAGLRCLTVTVPLDRSGRVPGKIDLHVEVLPGESRRGVLFLVAGGPGQGSASIFGLGKPDDADALQQLAPGYTLVAVDSRGTGRSGPLHCPMLVPAHLEATGPAAACARALGARRDFYGTADHAEDLDAVRADLGYESDRPLRRLVRHEARGRLRARFTPRPRRRAAARLGVRVPRATTPSSRTFFSRFPATLARLCAGGVCRAATRDFTGDVTAVANALAANPATGTVRRVDGTRRTVRLDGLGFLSFVVDADLNPGVAAELPALAHAARTGDVAPLLRAFDLDLGQSNAYSSVNLALFMATTCRDGPLPWKADTPLVLRKLVVDAGIAALPDGALGPLAAGRHAAATRSPASAGRPERRRAAGSRPLPDVPVLALSGDLDLRTPTADAASVVARFPQGHLLVVPGTGHSVLTGDASGCAEKAVHDWLDGRAVRKRCPPNEPYLEPLDALPATPAGRADGPHRTAALALATLREAEAAWLLFDGTGGKRIAGLHGGTLASRDDAFTLDHYSLVPGVALTGEVASSATAARRSALRTPPGEQITVPCRSVRRRLTRVARDVP